MGKSEFHLFNEVFPKVQRAPRVDSAEYGDEVVAPRLDTTLGLVGTFVTWRYRLHIYVFVCKELLKLGTGLVVDNYRGDRITSCTEEGEGVNEGVHIRLGRALWHTFDMYVVFEHKDDHIF